jgi:hypothetical protein
MFSASAGDAGMLNVVQSINLNQLQKITTKESFQSKVSAARLSRTGSTDYAEGAVEAIKVDCRSTDAGDRCGSAAISNQHSV